MKHLFIINPAAGGKRSRYKETIRHINDVMASYPEPYEVYITKAPMDACAKIRAEAESAGQLRVYACGGDGTLNECVNGAADFSHVAVTHYPTGTGNDFVKTFGPEDAVKFRNLPALVGGFIRPVDLIELQTPAGGRRFGINICSVGIDARIGTDVHKYSHIPLIGGATGYVVSMFVNLLRGINQRLKISTPDINLNGSFALVCACNGRFYGGGFNPVPEALPDDGIIDFLIVREVTRLKFLRIVGKYAKGRFREYRDIIMHTRGNYMKIESEKDLAVNVDGELILTKDILFKLIPRNINFVFPSGMRFFESIGS